MTGPYLGLRRQLRQDRFPQLWELFQRLFGATKQKAELLSERITAGDRILEIGCSTGLVAARLSLADGCLYKGIDVDRVALTTAKMRGLNKQFEFVHTDGSLTQLENLEFDLVVLSHVIHHVSDSDLMVMLSDLAQTFPGARLYVLEPEKALPNYSPLFRLFYRFENGEYRRSQDEICEALSIAGYTVTGVRAHEARVPIGLGLRTGRMWSFDAQVAEVIGGSHGL